MLDDGKVFQNLSSSGEARHAGTDEGANETADNSLSEGELGIGGPPGDRTQDTVIKSHVLYH